jgi:glycerol-3-phosphate dehydrogenase
MGRCQGGLCTARCMDILSERLRIPMHEVTKRGGGSWIAVPMDDGNPQRADGAQES